MEQNTTNSPVTIEASGTLKPKTGPKPKELVTAEYLGIPVGRDKKVIDPNDVQALAALGCKDKEIANFLGIKEDTLRYNFTDQLTKGREEVKISLRRAMLHNATVNHSASVQIFLAKNMLGMSDSPVDSEANAPLPWAALDD